ncbi:GDSL-type esterase/lipase family protein [Arthrobacter zhangbolii]|uniref:GDSL-type esterase/lipase family protein n=1 Tax=Arthrobacter zhangbolii TaxID=2886936 RepID=A0A9X1M8J4_9MICC|nr:SGNH/GDSL hydrolase family protein [Arthrobacter zhangbolii]MCC3273201.1 GDSL-type esterase/lipase family protein [Arthrobacter zhangbolii]UON92810.1 GDSL-type esterase/lipase family protein [Arthrobacter zhangbolii]
MKRLAAGVLAAVVILTACTATPAAGPSGPAGETTASGLSPSAAAPVSPSAPVPSAPVPSASEPEPSRPTGWLAAVTGDTGRLAILGDSFASGEGAGSYRPAGDARRDSCHRSTYAVASELFPPDSIANLACSRATTGHLTAPQTLAFREPTQPGAGPGSVPPQLQQLQGFDPTLVILSVGGNNLDFAGILQACLLDTRPCTENPALRADAAVQLAALQPDLEAAYSALASAVAAPVLVLPYPQLFDAPDGGCGRLSVEEQGFARELVGELNTVIRAAVNNVPQANVYFVEAAQDALDGHGACSEEPYLHAANVSGLLQAADSPTANQELLHPTRQGYRAMTDAIVEWAAAYPVTAG